MPPVASPREVSANQVIGRMLSHESAWVAALCAAMLACVGCVMWMLWCCALGGWLQRWLHPPLYQRNEPHRAYRDEGDHRRRLERRERRFKTNANL